MIKKENFDQYYYGHGKLLLSGEYFVLDGSKGLAVPTKFGQEMGVKYSGKNGELLHWKSYNNDNQLWFEATFENWKFEIVDGKKNKEALLLQKLLRQSRKQNRHFLREDENVEVVTKLGFPLKWGLGSSSSLIYNISQWAYISPFELLFKSYGGSGYDIACAQSSGPIVYTKNNSGPYWAPIHFNPKFSNKLYFVYLGKKQDSQKAVQYYKSLNIDKKYEIVKKLSQLTDQMISCQDFESFSEIIKEHENLVSNALNLQKVKDKFFKDFRGEIKSLGAWGGDFALVVSGANTNNNVNDNINDEKMTKEYFAKKGFNTVLSYKEIILSCEHFYDTEKNTQDSNNINQL